jgi:hypothetical protein
MNIIRLFDREVQDIELDGIHVWDQPDFCDVYVSQAYWSDGSLLTEEELDSLTEELHDSGELLELVMEQLR